jgi:hypothetical protein
MNAVRLVINETDPASRRAGSLLREEIENSCRDSEIVTVDLGAVLSISESFADELFGVLVSRKGLQWLSEHVAISNAKPAVIRTIADAVSSRLEEQDPRNPDIAILAGRKALEERRRASGYCLKQ